MRLFRSRSSLSLLAIGLWFAAGCVCAAQEVKFPDKSPLVSFTLPDGWFVDEESKADSSILDCIASATVKLRFRLFKETCSDADFKQGMPDFIKANLRSFGFDETSLDPSSIKVTSRPLGGKIQAVCAEVKLKSFVLDEPCLFRVVGFTVDGKSMLVMCGREESARKSGLDFDKILGSLKPVK